MVVVALRCGYDARTRYIRVVLAAFGLVLVWSGLGRFCLVWLSLFYVWFGLAWLGLAWLGLAWFHSYICSLMVSECFLRFAVLLF